MKKNRFRILSVFFSLLGLLVVVAGCRDTGVTNSLKSSTELQLSSLSDESTSQTFSAPPQSGFKSITLSLGTDFSASNVCSGETIFNLAGTASCQTCNTSMFSTAYRGVGSTRITSIQEGTLFPGVDLPRQYHLVPQIPNDDEGTCNSDSVFSCDGGFTPIRSVPRSAHNAFTVCGTTQSTIADRILDCRAKNGTTWTHWDGLHNATGAQGLWYLVTVAANTGSAPYSEVWQDQKTGLLWSSRTSIAVPAQTTPTSAPPWCGAAGNNDSTSSFCTDNVTSYCSETLGPNSAQATAGAIFSGDNYTTGVYDSAKGKMGLLSTPSVKWRLPTLNDYNQADVNGIRFVMPDMNAMLSTGNLEWTATVISTGSSRASAALFDTFAGGVVARPTLTLDTSEVLSALRSNTTRFVRCVGR